MGDVREVVPDYLHNQPSSLRVVDLSGKVRLQEFTGRVRLLRVSPSDAGCSWSLPFGQQLSLDLSVDAQFLRYPN